MKKVENFYFLYMEICYINYKLYIKIRFLYKQIALNTRISIN